MLSYRPVRLSWLQQIVTFGNGAIVMVYRRTKRCLRMSKYRGDYRWGCSFQIRLWCRNESRKQVTRSGRQRQCHLVCLQICLSISGKQCKIRWRWGWFHKVDVSLCLFSNISARSAAEKVSFWKAQATGPRGVVRTAAVRTCKSWFRCFRHK